MQNRPQDSASEPFRVFRIQKQGKSELAAAVALLLTCGDGEERAEVYGCAADRQQASIVFEVAADMVRMCPALSKRVKILTGVNSTTSTLLVFYCTVPADSDYTEEEIQS